MPPVSYWELDACSPLVHKPAGRWINALTRRHAGLLFPGKTTHIAALMGNTGRVLALDRSESKAAKIRRLAEVMGLDCIRAEGWDSTACLRQDGEPMPRTGVQRVGNEPFLSSCRP